jgi:pimeloyl-ACP methyl ester carboxylesterase
MLNTTVIENSTNVRNYRASILNGVIAFAVTLAPKLTARLVQDRFLATARHAWPKDEQVWKAKAEKQTLYTAGMPLGEWDGKPYVVYRWGQATRGKVVLQHGWNGRATQMYGFIEPLVAAGFQVIAMDAPGHGQSSGHVSSVLHFSSALTRLVRNEGPIEAIIAHSLGGGSTIHALTSTALPVKRAVLICPSADVGAFARFLADKIGLATRWLKWFQVQMETRLGTTWDELNAIKRAPRITIPVFVIHDKDDKEVSMTTGLAIANALPKSTLQITEGLGHRRILKNTDVINSAIQFVVNKTN